MVVYPQGDLALVADYGNVIDERTNDSVLALARALEEEQIAGVLELVPTFRSLMVCYDPAKIRYQALADRITKLADAVSGEQEDRQQEEAGTAQTKATKTPGMGKQPVELIPPAGMAARKEILYVPCLYGGQAGPDLRSMEQITGLSAQDIIRIHAGTTYKIYMLGFLPGFVYLGGLDPRIQAPRLEVPRTRIPAGTVAIGGAQTGVYPLDSPGGWRMIGATPLRFYNPSAAEPILCHAGEYIRFYPVTEKEYEQIAADVAAGTYQLEGWI